MPIALDGAQVTVMGLGRFGGGLGVARWLAGRGARVLVTDRAEAASLAASVAALDDLVTDGRVTLRLGGHDPRDFDRADLVVANPAIPTPWKNPLLTAAGHARVPITTEIRLVLERLDLSRVIGVTGTAGKSTTAAMIHHALGRLGHRSRLGGNIGGSILPDIDAVEPDALVVVELSSAMLHWLDAGTGYPAAPGLAPRIAVLTNLGSNHLDWHGSLEHYRRCKERIFTSPAPDAVAIRGTEVAPLAADVRLGLPGTHNRANAAVALETVRRATGASAGATAHLLEGFRGLPHRLELVTERGGQRFFNDSKSTTPPATVLAVEAFDEPSRVHLIAGGYERGADLAPIGRLTDRIAGLYTIGATGRALAEIAVKPSRATRCETLERAVTTAMNAMRAGDVLLLSPGCASWDQFDNFEARGAAFARAVQS